MSDTPETQEAVERWQQGKINIFDEMARLERERNESRSRALTAILERDRWKMLAEEKWALRRELEELLGVAEGPAGDEQFSKGLAALRELLRERNEARAECLEQARLLSMSAEREEKLLTQIRELKAGK